MNDLERDNVKKAAAALYGECSNEQGRNMTLTLAQLVEARQRNNTERPSFYGYLIDDLLTTCAVLLTKVEHVQKLLLAQTQLCGVALAEADSLREERDDLVRQNAVALTEYGSQQIQAECRDMLEATLREVPGAYHGNTLWAMTRDVCAALRSHASAAASMREAAAKVCDEECARNRKTSDALSANESLEGEADVELVIEQHDVVATAASSLAARIRALPTSGGG